MSEKPISQRVKELLSEQLGEDVERMEDHVLLIEELGVDLLDLVELVMAIEDEFKLEPDDEDVEKWRTVGDMVRWIEGKME